MLVHLGNNWIQKIPLTAKLDSACGLVQFWLSSEFLSSNYVQIGQHVILLHTNCTHSISRTTEARASFAQQIIKKWQQHKPLLYKEFTIRRDCLVRLICHYALKSVIMGFKQKLSKKNLVLHFWILSSAKLAMRTVSPVRNEQYPLIEFKIKQVVIWKHWTHLQGRVLGIISFAFYFWNTIIF